MMAKFKRGDRVRCVVPDRWGDRVFNVGEVVIVDMETVPNEIFLSIFGDKLWSDNWELATPEPIPDTVTIGGVEYVRKPEPEHVWAWGQWARVKASGLIVFVTGSIKGNGFVPVTHKGARGQNNTDGYMPDVLTYLGTATIPE